MTQQEKDFFKQNKKMLIDWLSRHLEAAKEQTISLDDRDVAGRSQAIIEARTYKKLMADIGIIIGEKTKQKTNSEFI